MRLGLDGTLRLGFPAQYQPQVPLAFEQTREQFNVVSVASGSRLGTYIGSHIGTLQLGSEETFSRVVLRTQIETSRAHQYRYHDAYGACYFHESEATYYIALQRWPRVICSCMSAAMMCYPWTCMTSFPFENCRDLQLHCLPTTKKLGIKAEPRCPRAHKRKLANNIECRHFTFTCWTLQRSKFILSEMLQINCAPPLSLPTITY